MRNILYVIALLFITFGCVKQIRNFDVEKDASTTSSSVVNKMQLLQGDFDFDIDSGYYFVQVSISEKSKSIDVNSRIESGKIKSVEKLTDNRFILAADAPKFNSQDYVSFIYRGKNKKMVIVLPRIVISLKEGRSIESVLQKYSNVLKIEKVGKVKYVVGCNYKNSEKILEIVRSLKLNDEIEWCEPEMLSEMRVDNALYPNQYYLRNTGQNGGTQGIDINVEPAWQITNGSPNISVAVIDQGVDANHEDMGARVLQGYTIRNPLGLGAPENPNNSDSKGHGQACAGIIAATNNTIGIRGVASNINILPVNIAPDFFVSNWATGFGSNIEIAEAINWAWKRADILSCSWGGGNYSADIVTAIDSARQYGRNGRGCVVVFASGNDYPNTADVSFPGNVNGVVTVGAINNQGNIWNYSQRGNSLDLVAPSGNVNLLGDLVTTDRMNNLGYETGNYTQRFGGTSAACPQVAGVAALLLSIRPELTSSQVTSVLQNTARDLGPTGFDNTYGYGLVNAGAAVQSILPTISGPSQVCTSATYTVQNLPQGAIVQSWATSGMYTYISPSGSNSATFSYVSIYDYRFNKSIITAIVLLSNGQTVPVTYGVVWGIPDFSIQCVMNCSGYYSSGTNYVFFAWPPNANDFVNQQAYYTWKILRYDNGRYFGPTYQQTIISGLASFVNTQPVIVFPSAGDYDVEVTVGYACGFDRKFAMPVNVVNGNYLYSLKLDNNYTSVSISGNSQSLNRSISVPVIDEIIIMGKLGSRKYTQFLNTTNHRIAIDDLPNGIYTVKFYSKEKLIETQTIPINRK